VAVGNDPGMESIAITWLRHFFTSLSIVGFDYRECSAALADAVLYGRILEARLSVSGAEVYLAFPARLGFPFSYFYITKTKVLFTNFN
jgi:hypothetical protein